MKIEQRMWTGSGGGWRRVGGGLEGARANIVLVFGGREVLADPAILATIRRDFPGGRVVLASSAGEICGTRVSVEELTLTALSFSRSSAACVAASVRSQYDSWRVGSELAQRLIAPDLVHVFVVSDGQLVNGTELSRGFNEHLPPGVELTGGLAGDGSRFEQTLVGLDEVPTSGRVVAIGFYGRDLRVGFGSSGGWEPVGGDYEVTRSSGNIVFALDDQPALQLYREYLGEEAASLPASALRHPLSVAPPEEAGRVVRTILSVEDFTQSMVFAGDVPLGSRVRFMHASPEALVAGAQQAAVAAQSGPSIDLALCVSCIGRRLVLRERASEEVEAVQRVFGQRTVLAGFYSYGELAPAQEQARCQLHNQTMTITTLTER